ncbi:MAG: hypothetical protein ABIR70_11845 [Bryobacteraceae bacterium]
MKFTRYAVHGTSPIPQLQQRVQAALEAAGASRVDTGAEFLLQWDETPIPLPHPPGGVWRLAGADPGPLAFWEVYDGLFHLELRLERHTEPTCFLDRRWIPVDRLSYAQTLENAITEMVEMVVHAARCGTPGVVDPVWFPPRQSMPPTAAAQLLLKMKLAVRFAMAQWRGVWFAESWMVGVVEAPVTEFLDMGYQPEIHWLPSPTKQRFLADPFLARLPDGWLLMAEDFDFATNLGRIVQEFSASGNFTGQVEDAIDTGCHMSYPFLLEHAGELYCIPETHQLDGVFLWRWDAPRRKWLDRRPILEGRWLDPTLIRHEERWWMFATHKDHGPDSKLHLFYADHLEGPWQAHPGNPVKVDVRSSRPGGTPFVEGGKLYRPAQDSSKHYGWRMVVNLVTRLTPAEFAEETVRVVDSDRLGISGIHTLSGAAGRTLVDGWKPRFVPARAVRVLVHKLRKLARV